MGVVGDMTERERERERDVCIYIYTLIYTKGMSGDMRGYKGVRLRGLGFGFRG